MPKRAGSLGTPLRGAGRSRTPVLTILAVRQPPRANTPAPRPVNGHSVERRTLHDVVAAPQDGSPPLTLDELLTGWLSSLGQSLEEPESFAEFGDYAKHVERVCRARHAADCICRKLDSRLADWGSRRLDGIDNAEPQPPSEPRED